MFPSYDMTDSFNIPNYVGKASFNAPHLNRGGEGGGCQLSRDFSILEKGWGSKKIKSLDWTSQPQTFGGEN